MITILVFLIVLSILVLSHELGHFLSARWCGVKVEEFGLGMFFRLYSFKRGETVYSINALPIGGFVRLLGEDGDNHSDPRSFSAQSKLKRIFILSAGVLMNLLLAFVLLTVVYLMGMPEWGSQVKITGIASDSPAQKASLQIDDLIVKMAGQEITASEDLQEITSDHLGQSVELEIKREDSYLTRTVFIREYPPEGEGAMGIQMVTQPAIIRSVKYPLFQAPLEAGKAVFTIMSEMVLGLIAIFNRLFSQGKVPEGVTGPVGIGQIFGELLKFGLAPILQFSAIFSLNLVLLNILPFPALDGGRILFISIEALICRRIPARVEGIIHAGGLVLLMILFVLVTYRDILRLFN